MNIRDISPPPSKALLLFRLFVVIAVTFAFVEMAEFAIKSVYHQHGELFEVLVDSVLVSILFVDIYYLLARPMFKEIARRVEVEDELRKSEAAKQAILDAIPDTLLRVSHDGILIDYKLESESVVNVCIGMHVNEIFPESVLEDVTNSLKSTIAGGAMQKVEIKLSERQDEYHQELRFVKSASDEALITISNITDRKKYEEKLKYISTHDALTGLYNRTFYEAEVERLVKGRQYPIGIIIIDLDGLKETNDTHGHAAGDKMIRKAADVLNKVFRGDDLVCRTGGDEFTILLTETNYNELQLVVNRIHESLKEANAAKPKFELSFSLGTAIAETKEGFHEAVRIADARMYENKASRKTEKL